MQFTFTLPSKEGPLHFEVKRVYSGQSIEKFLVTLVGRNSILIQSNRPYLLYHKLDLPITWKQLTGIRNKSLFTRLTLEMAVYLKDDLPVIQSPVLTLF